MIRSNQITNEKMDELLLVNNKLIKRLSDVVRQKDYVLWRCLKIDCGYEWEATPGMIIHKNSGCPKCAGNAKITNDSVDYILLTNKRTIKRIEDVGRDNTKIKWQCLICDYIWSAPPSGIKYGHGCLRCAGYLPVTNEIMDTFIFDNKLMIERLDDMKKCSDPIKWKCLKCQHIWIARPNGIRNMQSGCPICNKAGLNEKIVYQFLLDKNIEFVSQFKIDNDYTAKRFFWVDFYIPKLNLFIEYNGIRHYQVKKFKGLTKARAEENFPLQVKRDEYVRKYADDHNINLLEIDGRTLQKKKLINFLENYFQKVAA